MREMERVRLNMVVRGFGLEVEVDQLLGWVCGCEVRVMKVDRTKGCDGGYVTKMDGCREREKEMEKMPCT